MINIVILEENQGRLGQRVRLENKDRVVILVKVKRVSLVPLVPLVALVRLVLKDPRGLVVLLEVLDYQDH
jgi:hypothetical protein